MHCKLCTVVGMIDFYCRLRWMKQTVKMADMGFALAMYCMYVHDHCMYLFLIYMYLFCKAQ